MTGPASNSLPVWPFAVENDRKPAQSTRRVFGYLSGVFARGLRWWQADPEAIARGTGMGRRTVERALAAIRRAPQPRFEFRRVRLGRLWHVEVWDRQARPLPPSPPIPSVRFAKAFRKHGGAGFASGGLPMSPSPAGWRRLRSLAAFLARHRLAGCHWDNCKVVFRFGHAFRFALSALCKGHGRERIVTVYDRALHRRHADCVDSGGGAWAPSSTVSLAQTFLFDGKDDAERVAERFDILLPEKRANDELRARCRAAFA